MSPNEKKGKRESLRLLGTASTVGINLVISTFIGFAIGWFLDNKIFDTSPWFTLIFLILGIAAGFKYLFKIALRAGDKNNGDSKRSN